MNEPQYEVSKCRSCQRNVIWARTPAGALMPLDARPVTPYMLQPAGSDLNAVPVAGSGLVGTGDGAMRISHFLTCPNASTHSKGGRS